MRIVLVHLLFYLFTCAGFAETKISHFFPDNPLLLGEPLFWTVKLQHPMWESYEIKFGPCPDVKMSVAEKKLTEVAGELRVLYRVSVIPVSLKASCTPTLTLSDEKGQTTVLSGKPLSVHRISGDSEILKAPVLPGEIRQSKSYYLVLFSLLAILAILCAIFFGKRIYNNTPAQRLLKDIQKASEEVRKDRLPIQVWRLLRSEFLWGFEAEPYTPTQLRKRALANPQLVGIATALLSLESWRYSGSSNWDRDVVKQALKDAETMVRARGIFQRRKNA